MKAPTIEKHYKHPKICLCRQCGGAGFTTRLDEREENEVTELCPNCEGSGRVVVSGVTEATIQPFVPLSTKG